MTTTFELLEPRRLFAGVPAGNVFVQTNIVSDGFVTAAHTDVDLKNPWGVSFLPSGPFWISDNGTSKTTVYDSTGSKALSVNIPRWRAGIGADRAGAESVLQRLRRHQGQRLGRGDLHLRRRGRRHLRMERLGR